MFERFTERARQVVVLAQDEARRLKHNYIGTEHILLGLLREEEGVAARTLESLGVGIEEVRAQVGRVVGYGDEVPSGQIPFTPRTKKVLELALREGLALGHNYIGTEHLLLGLARENEGVAARILLDFGVEAEDVQEAVLGQLAGRPPDEQLDPSYRPQSPPLTPEVAERLDELRRRKKAALEAQEFEEAARHRAEERRLARAAHALEQIWSGAAPPPPAGFTPAFRRGLGTRSRPSARRVLRRPLRDVLVPLVLGWLLFGLAAGIGVLIGWAIWG